MNVVLTSFLVIGIIFIKILIKNNEILSRRIECIYGGSLLFLHGALRGDTVGIDVNGYIESFYQTAMMSYSEILNMGNAYVQSRDPIFYCFLKFLSEITDNHQIILVVISFIVSIGISLFIYRSSRNVLISFLAFICLRIYSFTLSGLRQAIAMSILWIGCKYIGEKKPFKFLFLVLIASMFHSSALIFIIAYPISKLNRIKPLLIGSTFFIIVNFITNNMFIKLLVNIPVISKYAGYLQGVKNLDGKILFILQIAILIFVLIYKDKIIKASKMNIMYINMLIIGIVFSFLGFSFPNMFRIGYYFNIFMIILLPNAIRLLSDNNLKIIINYILIVVITIQYWVLGAGAGVDNYVFFWDL